jgi:sulfite reductase (NADPH) flavoprotein alpha-component
MFARSQLALNRSTAEIVRWEPYSSASLGRKFRIWVRGLHTGEALGFAGQTVAGLASLGGCFLVWTGMAMAWRRFRYRKRQVDELAFAEPENPQEKRAPAMMQSTPQTDEVLTEVAKAKMKEMSPAATNGHSYEFTEDALDVRSSALDSSDSVLLLYGTVTGTAESLAYKVAAALRAAGQTVSVRDVAHCQPHVLTQANCVLMVVSTYGDGEPPEDAVPFWKAVVRGNGLDLRGIKFSVLALGNTTYDQFCQCGRDFDAALERHGATRIFPRVDCDVDYDVPAAYWLRGVVAHLVEDKRSALPA